MDLRAPLHDIVGYAGGASPKCDADGTAPRPSSSSEADGPSFESMMYQHLCRMYVASQAMELGAESRFTGMVLFHRYVRRFHRLVKQKHAQSKEGEKVSTQELDQMKKHLGPVAAACLFLGCKMEEEPRRIRDVLNLSHLLNFSSLDDGALKSTADEQKESNERPLDGPITIVESKHPPPLDESYWTSKEQMVSTEQHVLRMIQFDTTVCHPHRCVLIIMETLGFGTGKEGIGHENESNWLLLPNQSENIILRAWRILNEAPLEPRGAVLELPVMVLSCASISLAAEGGVGNDGVTEVDGGAVNLPECWWRALDVDANDIVKAKEGMRTMLQLKLQGRGCK